ncbi:MAG: c-type cytochrome [Pseudomonadales bacterium]|nr:c-type cytochrome [Pseudomonadales bacterium]
MRSLSSFIVLVLLFCANSALGQNANPLEGNGRAIYAGAALFRAQCATCHGADAKGISSIDAPDLTLMWAERQRSAQEVYAIIRDGVPGSIMPPHGLTDTELWMLVAYLQDAAVSGVIGLPEGDVNHGEQLFTQHCAECHRAKGVGGALGPNLSVITKRRSLEALTTSVREPSALIGRGYKPLTLVTGSDEELQGVLKSEDAFSLQLLDRNQRLRAFMKSDLRSLQRDDESLMPAFSSAQLSDDELIDILNYLDSP